MTRSAPRNSTAQTLVITQAAHGFTAYQVVRGGGGTVWQYQGDPTPSPSALGWSLATRNDQERGLVGLILEVLDADRFRVVIGGIIDPGIVLPNILENDALAPGVWLSATPGEYQTTGDLEAFRLGYVLPDGRVLLVQPANAFVPETSSGVYNPSGSLWIAYPSLAGETPEGTAPVRYPRDNRPTTDLVGGIWYAGASTGHAPRLLTPGTVGQVLAMADGIDGELGFRVPAWTTLTAAAVGAVPTTRTITAGAGLTGGGDLTANRTLALATSGVSAGSYGSGTAIPVLTIDAYGRITTASTVTINTTPDSMLGVSTNGWIKRTGVNTYTANAAIPWGDLTGVPGTFTPSAHTHAATDITSGFLATARGGIGTTVAAAVAAVNGASRPDLFLWWDKTGSAWTTYQMWNSSAVTGWINCYDSAAADTNAKTTGVMAGTGLSVFGRSANTDGLPAAIVAGTDGQVLRRSGTTVGFGAIDLAAAAATTGALPATKGGTGQTALTTGDLLYASATNTLSKRAIGTTGQVLTVSGGVPTWATPAGVGNTLTLGANGTTLGSWYTYSLTTGHYATCSGGVVTIFKSGVAVVSINVTDVVASINGTTTQIKLREIDECDSSGNAKKRMYLCSAQY